MYSESGCREAGLCGLVGVKEASSNLSSSTNSLHDLRLPARFCFSFFAPMG